MIESPIRWKMCRTCSLSLPSRSPGDPTAGARARGGSRGASSQQGARGGVGQGGSRVPPSVGSSRQSGSRGRMPPPGPNSRHQAQLYHQVLYYTLTQFKEELQIQNKSHVLISFLIRTSPTMMWTPELVEEAFLSA